MSVSPCQTANRFQVLSDCIESETKTKLSNPSMNFIQLQGNCIQEIKINIRIKTALFKSILENCQNLEVLSIIPDFNNHKELNRQDSLDLNDLNLVDKKNFSSLQHLRILRLIDCGELSNSDLELPPTITKAIIVSGSYIPRFFPPIHFNQFTLAKFTGARMSWRPKSIEAYKDHLKKVSSQPKVHPETYLEKKIETYSKIIQHRNSSSNDTERELAFKKNIYIVFSDVYWFGPFIRVINLAFNGELIGITVVKKILHKCKNIEFLRLYGQNVTKNPSHLSQLHIEELDDADLTALSELKQLMHLNLYACHTISNEFFKHLPTSIQTIDIKAVSISYEPNPALNKIEKISLKVILPT